ncbi:MAG: DUF4372 domain-containing protein, partial [bacterium]
MYIGRKIFVIFPSYSLDNGINLDRTIFSQLMDFVPRHTFRSAVKRCHGDRRVRQFTCWEQFLCMAFAQ